MTMVSAITLSQARARTATGETAGSLTAWVGVCVLLVSMPFEMAMPWLSLPGQSITSAEAVLLATLGAWLAVTASTRQWPAWRTPLAPAWGALLGAWLVASLRAPEFGANALHMCGRLAVAGAVSLLTLHGVTTWARLRGVLAFAAATGVLLSAIVVLDYVGIEPVRSLLTGFRPFVAHVGAQVRASGPFQYPTIASMYLEVLFALSVPLLAVAIERRQRARAWLLGAALVAIAQASVLTFTRAGLLAMTAALAVVAWCRYRARGADAVILWLALLAVIVVAQFLTSRSAESIALRLTTEGMDAWYSASIEAPHRLEASTGGTTAVTVTLTNTGRVTWDSALTEPFRVSYHWLTADGARVVSWEGQRTPFPQPVEPGGRVTLVMQVIAPRQPGTYRLMWDVEQEHRLWFSTEPGATQFLTIAEVSGPMLGSNGPLTALPRPLAHGTVRPGRLVLWTAAARMFAAHPATGVGPDNFRLQYGRYLGLSAFDPRIHSNNMYLEILAGTGLLGAGALAFFLWRSAATVVAALRDARDASSHDGEPVMLVAAVAAGCTAIAVHGLVDAFLSFTATYVLIAIAMGLAAAGAAIGRSHAHRL